MLTAVAAIAPLCVLGVVLTAASWWEGLIIGAGLLLTLGVLREWSLDGYPRRAVFALVFTGVNWLVGALTTSSPINFVPFSLVGALLLARLPRRQRLRVVGFSLGVALVGSTALLTHPPDRPLVAAFVVLPAAGTLFIAGIIIASEQAWLVVRRLERARETEVELAVARERVRFAGDLHDIQGHSLHVVKLKAAHAQRLVRTDADRAEAELLEIRGIVDDTIVRARELAHARHELNLATELENTKRLCEAVGIAVDVRHDTGSGARAHPLLAQVLREATTNLLRHARPRTVSITASPSRVEITNDGVAAEPGPEPDLRGLARLRSRVEVAGGALRITRPSGGFALAADLDPRPLPATDPGGGV